MFDVSTHFKIRTKKLKRKEIYYMYSLQRRKFLTKRCWCRKYWSFNVCASKIRLFKKY